MRLHIKKQMLDLSDTLMEAVEYIKEAPKSNLEFMIKNCLDATAEITKIVEVEDNSNDILLLINKISEQFNVLMQCTNKPDFFKSSCEKIIEEVLQIKVCIETNINCKIEIAFFPYKSSMWDCMESVWRAARQDENCECYVVPIPYLELNGNGVQPKLCYEGKNFPDDVPILQYWLYDLEEHRPDIIYIHNPYDQHNKVTQVEKTYFSTNLKNYTDMLVYIPYFIEGSYDNMKDANLMCATSGALNVDRIIVQSESHKELFLKFGFQKKKIMALGTPKFDAVLYASKKYSNVTDKWKKALGNKKVFLWNTSIFSMCNNNNWMEQMNQIVAPFCDNDDCALIWRPHPLLETSIQSMAPRYKQEYDSFQKKLLGMNNVIIDHEPDAYHAITVSDALISDYSSIMLQYIITGKPILSVDGKSSIKEKCICILDYFSNYFLEDGMSIELFIDMVLRGEDTKKEDRLKAMKKSTINTDGSCGEKVHKCIMKELLSRE